MSVTAPIVQKLTRLATAPNTNASANARPATSAGRCGDDRIHSRKLSHAPRCLGALGNPVFASPGRFHGASAGHRGWHNEENDQ